MFIYVYTYVYIHICFSTMNIKKKIKSKLLLHLKINRRIRSLFHLNGARRADFFLYLILYLYYLKKRINDFKRDIT